MDELGSAVFIAAVRGALAQRGAAPGAGLARLRATIDVSIADGDGPSSEPATFDLLGPGDVRGIAGAQILRTDPKPGAHDVEPNYVAIIEFDAPELPWALSPDPGSDTRVQPWIALVVVPEDQGQLLQGAGSTLPTLRCAADLLPPCGESWAWAHAQVVPTANGVELSDLLEQPEHAASTLSRLVCPTKLQPNTRYLACVVPTFAASVKAASGAEQTGLGLSPAWGADPQVSLPVYHSWRFRTCDRGDFEELARLLHPVVADTIAGLGRVDLSLAPEAIPGFADPAVLPALRTLLTTEQEFDALRSEHTDPAVQQALAAIVSPDAAPADPPEVRPPVYGRWPAQLTSLTADTPGWVGDLNRAPSHRVVARLGADLVRKQQEELVADARRQAGEQAAAQAARDRLRLGELAASRLVARRFDGVPDPRLLEQARPALTAIPSGDGGTIAATIDASTIDRAVLGAAWSRTSRRAATAMQVPAGALRKALVAGAFDHQFTAPAVTTPRLTTAG